MRVRLTNASPSSGLVTARTTVNLPWSEGFDLSFGYPGFNPAASSAVGASMGWSRNGHRFENISFLREITLPPSLVGSTRVHDIDFIAIERVIYGCYADIDPLGESAPSIKLCKTEDGCATFESLATLPVTIGDTEVPGNVAEPNWGIDENGDYYITGVKDSPGGASHQVFALSAATGPETWNNPASWDGGTILTDVSDAELIQGNTYVKRIGGQNLMMYNNPSWDGYKKRTSSSFLTGWSTGVDLNIEANNIGHPCYGGDGMNFYQDANGDIALTLAGGNNNNLTVQGFTSSDGGDTWTSGPLLTFHGFGQYRALFNWQKRTYFPPQ